MALKKFVMVKFLNDTMVDPPISEVRQSGQMLFLVCILVLPCLFFSGQNFLRRMPAQIGPMLHRLQQHMLAGVGELLASLPAGSPAATVFCFCLILTVVWVLQKRPSQGHHSFEGDLAVQRGTFFWAVSATFTLTNIAS